MKIAISGKGGVGKTLLASFLSKIFADSGYSVLAIDADSNATLAATLGFPNAGEITPISEMKELIEERTGATPGKSGTYFRLNPKVDDLPEKFWREHRGIKLMVMGQLKRGSSGCYCPENAMLQALVSHLLLARNEVIIMDMEAGIEHLGRATARAVDVLIIVAEPARRSIETASKIRQLAGDMGVHNIAVVGNKIRNQSEKEFLTSSLADFKFLGFIPYEPALLEADIAGVSIIDSSPKVMAVIKDIYKALTSGAKIEIKNNN